MDPKHGIEGEPVFASRPAPGPKPGGDGPPDHTVWDEPSVASRAAPPGAESYAAWLDAGLRRASPARGWLIALALAAVAGPWSVLGAFFSAASAETLLGLLAVVAFGPVAEEICKVSALMIAIERAPHWFTSRAQILVAALASGVVFALIENQIYFRVYLQDPSPDLIAWRETVCVALHAGCSLIAGCGLAKMWGASLAARARPRPEHAAGFVGAACLIHGAYNFAAVLLDLVIR